jgi:hypothetical protein
MFGKRQATTPRGRTNTSQQGKKPRLEPITTAGLLDDYSEDDDSSIISSSSEQGFKLIEAQERAMDKALETEKKARAEAGERWDVTIDPSSDEFLDCYEEFRAALQDSGQTTEHVLETSGFTAHERALLAPMERARNPSLHRIQVDNSRQYHHLLTMERFSQWKDKANLAFKLTMLWFGLPVAPMTVDFAQRLGTWMDDSEDPAHESSHVLSVGRLRFLNSYGVRYYGKDALRGEPICHSAYDFVHANEILQPLIQLSRTTTPTKACYELVLRWANPRLQLKQPSLKLSQSG